MNRKRISITTVAASVFAGAVVLAGAEDTVASNRLEQVIVVFKTHFDIGYTDMASNVVTKYRTTMIDQALQVVDQNRGLPPEQQFAWTIPGWPMKKITEDWPGQTPERKQRVLQAFRDGRFVVHALPFTTHTELLEAEDLVRGMRFSSQLARDAGLPLPRDAKMTDVPSHSWFIPTMLRHAGVDFLHLGCNPASRSPQVPPLFWWEGPDGSRVLTMYSAQQYGTGLGPPPDWPYRTWLALIHTGDNHGPPTPDEVKKLFDQAKKDLPGIKVRIGRLSDFADAILAEKPNLLIVRGDMPDTWIHGPMSDPAGAKLARIIRPALATAEFLATEMAGWGLRLPARSNTLAEASENSLLYGEHTWGGAFWWIYGKYVLPFGDEWKAERTAGKFQRIESSWDEHTACIEKAQSLIAPLLADEITTLAQSVSVAGPRIVVFNPLPWQRDGIVTLKTAVKLAAVKPAPGGDIAAVNADSESLTFVARGLPPMGYQTFVPVKEKPAAMQLKADAQAATLENGFFKITLDRARGSIASLMDTRSGRELVDPTAPQGFGQYLYERFDRDQVQAFVQAYVKISADWGLNELGKPSMPPATQTPYIAASPKNFQLRFERTPVSVSAVMAAPAGGGVPNAVTTRFTLYADQAWVDLEVTVHNKPFDPWPEAGWICLPFKVESPQFRLGRLGSIIDPAKDIVGGCNFHLFALNSGMTITDAADRGVGLCPLDSPLVSLGEPGGWKYSKAFTPRKSRVFINLFNNQWSTNFRLWNAGTWTSRVRVWSVEGNDAGKNLVAPSAEARFPLAAVIVDGAAGKLSPSQIGLELSRPSGAVTAFGPNPDGNGTLLRLWEQAGQSAPVRVQLPPATKATVARPVDLRGRISGDVMPIQSGSFTVPMRAFAPASFILETTP